MAKIQIKYQLTEFTFIAEMARKQIREMRCSFTSSNFPKLDFTTRLVNDKIKVGHRFTTGDGGRYHIAEIGSGLAEGYFRGGAGPDCWPRPHSDWPKLWMPMSCFSKIPHQEGSWTVWFTIVVGFPEIVMPCLMEYSQGAKPVPLIGFQKSRYRKAMNNIQWRHKKEIHVTDRVSITAYHI
jgi:hypothetical protein